MFNSKLVTVRASSLEVGEVYFISLHDNKDIKIAVRLESRPNCAIRDMGENDKYVLRRISGGPDLILRRNKNAPHFLVTESRGVRGPTSVRVTMYRREQEPVYGSTARDSLVAA